MQLSHGTHDDRGQSLTVDSLNHAEPQIDATGFVRPEMVCRDSPARPRAASTEDKARSAMHGCKWFSE